jgi:hypothetical protein
MVVWSRSRGLSGGVVTVCKVSAKGDVPLPCVWSASVVCYGGCASPMHVQCVGWLRAKGAMPLPRLAQWVEWWCGGRPSPAESGVGASRSCQVVVGAVLVEGVLVRATVGLCSMWGSVGLA